MSVKKFPDPKDPGDDLDYVNNWANVLTTGETITTSTWTVPAGLTSHDESHTGTTAVIWLAGGVVDVDYTLTNVITTSLARVFERDVVLKVRNL